MAAYYFSNRVAMPFDQAEIRVREELKKEGFGVLTEIDVSRTFKEKLDVEFRPYKILGACNPSFAHQALSSEDKVGTMLPCNVILQKTADAETEVAAVDPQASMQAIENEELAIIAREVATRLRSVIERI